MTRLSLIAALTAVFIAGFAGKPRSIAAEDAKDATAILKKADAAGFAKSTRMKVIQKVITPSGDTRTFNLLTYTQDGNEKSLTHYVSPEQVRGMKVLTLRDGNDIWSYFPRTNRVRKLASSARNRKVQGSDFTYDDMAQGKMVKQWRGKVLGEEKTAGRACFKLELFPTDAGPKSYKRTITWIDKSNYSPVRIDYYDLDNYLQKRLELKRYKKIQGVLIPFDYVMLNLTDGGKTLMKVAAAEVNIKLDPVIFTEAGLSR
jgi:outer membrane lipoprotein-sorting protein